MNDKTEMERMDNIRSWLIDKIAAELQVNPSEIDVRKPFTSYGLESASAISTALELEEWLGHRLPETLLWDYPSIEELVRYLAKLPIKKAEV